MKNTIIKKNASSEMSATMMRICKHDMEENGSNDYDPHYGENDTHDDDEELDKYNKQESKYPNKGRTDRLISWHIRRIDALKI